MRLRLNTKCAAIPTLVITAVLTQPSFCNDSVKFTVSLMNNKTDLFSCLLARSFLLYLLAYPIICFTLVVFVVVNAITSISPTCIAMHAQPSMDGRTWTAQHRQDKWFIIEAGTACGITALVAQHVPFNMDG
jgi:hypothetical protein